MKKIVFLILALALFVGCGSKDKGELTGVKGKRWHPEKPYGMSLIPAGSFTMGKSDDDIVDLNDAPNRTVSVSSFYMDETEITNSEYRQFVEWVRDSVVRRKLATTAFAKLGADLTEDDEKLEKGIGLFYPKSLIKDKDASDTNDDGEFSYAAYKASGNSSVYSYYNDDEKQGPEYFVPLDWEVELSYDEEDFDNYDQTVVEIIEDMILPKKQWHNGIKTWDVRKFEFEYSDMNIEAASEAYDDIQSGQQQRSDYIQKIAVQVYPDTTVWIKDFKHVAHTIPMHNDYFWHEGYGDYPVVGVNFQQAQAFCQWRTIYKNGYQKSKKKHNVNIFRLPSEAEWEYAARGGLQGAAFPWGGPYAKNDRGCFLANFKPMRGDYLADQALYTVEADAYDPNGYDLYNMAGNVSEWVDTSYEPNSYEQSATFNPNISNRNNPMKIVRGGSWKDVKYFLQVSTRDYADGSIPTSYIGFRTVQDYLGVDVKANSGTN